LHGDGTVGESAGDIERAGGDGGCAVIGVTAAECPRTATGFDDRVGVCCAGVLDDTGNGTAVGASKGECAGNGVGVGVGVIEVGGIEGQGTAAVVDDRRTASVVVIAAADLNGSVRCLGTTPFAST